MTRCGHLLGGLRENASSRGTETRPSDYGGRRCSCSTNRENLGRSDRLQDRTPSQLYAGPDPDPEKGPQGSKRADRRSQSQCSNCGRHGRHSHTYHNNHRCHSSTACISHSPHLPGLRCGTKLLPPSLPSNGSSPSMLLPLRRRRPLRVQLSCSPSPSTPPPPARMRQRLEDKYWSCRPTRTTPTPILTCI